MVFSGRTAQIRVRIGVQVLTTCLGCAGAFEANDAPRAAELCACMVIPLRINCEACGSVDNNRLQSV